MLNLLQHPSFTNRGGTGEKWALKQVQGDAYISAQIWRLDDKIAPSTTTITAAPCGFEPTPDDPAIPQRLDGRLQSPNPRALRLSKQPRQQGKNANVF